jgi:hypothetical protein
MAALIAGRSGCDGFATLHLAGVCSVQHTSPRRRLSAAWPPADMLGRGRKLPRRKSTMSGGPDMCDATQMQSACSSVLMPDTMVLTSMSATCAAKSLGLPMIIVQAMNVPLSSLFHSASAAGSTSARLPCLRAVLHVPADDMAIEGARHECAAVPRPRYASDRLAAGRRTRIMKCTVGLLMGMPSIRGSLQVRRRCDDWLMYLCPSRILAALRVWKSHRTILPSWHPAAIAGR